ncbi:MAG: hypothetical protein ACK496_05860 [Acidobacteriota bacterium]
MSWRMTILKVILILLVAAVCTPAQERPRPVSRQEIIDHLRQSATTPRQSGQGDLAEMITDRGVDFPVDEKALEEFRRLGARSFLLNAILIAGSAATPPSPAASPAAERPRLRSVEPSPSPEPTTGNGDQGREEPTPEERAAMLATLPLIEQARYYALEYTDELPNFRVTQFVTRYVRGPSDKDWVKRDTLELELTYSDKAGEKYRLVKLNGLATKMGYDQVAGSTSTGEFGALMSSLFSPRAKTEFRETGREQFNGRAAVMFEFRVKKVNSNSELTDRTTGRSVVAGYQGTVWIDLESKRVLRIELAHENMPPGFPITIAENSVDYDWVTIAGERYLLPVRAEVLLGRERDREYSRNLIEFRQYQKFDTDVKLVPDNY